MDRPSSPSLPRSRLQDAAERGFRAEELVAKLLQQLGYQVAREVRMVDIGIDIVATKDGQSVAVEVSSRTDNRNIINKLRTDAARLQSFISTGDASEAIIAVFGPLSVAAKEWSESQFGLNVWDLETLLSKAQPFPKLHKEFESFVADLPSRPVGKKDDVGPELIGELERHIGGHKLTPAEYEDLCQRVFIHVFDPRLYGFKKQARTSDGANRYDFICRIKSGEPFWDNLRADF
jgi:Holliday junction resolvase